MKAIRIHEPGGPDVLKYEDVEDPTPGPGQALMDVQAIGVNFADVNNRKNANPANLPTILGMEAAGVVAAVGDGVTEASVGDLVAYCGSLGSYAERHAVPSQRLVKLPEGIDFPAGAASMCQGMTAHYLTHSSYPLKEGDTCLIQGGAGGVANLTIQMAKRLGALVITTVSSEEKAQIAREAGADRVIIYTREDFLEETMKATGGKGVRVVYDSVGKDTFDKGMACVGLRGYMVIHGGVSGRVDPSSYQSIRPGSKYITNPSLMDFIGAREEMLWRANEVLGWVLSGEIKLCMGRTFPLAEAVEAHRWAEDRATAGKVILTP